MSRPEPTLAERARAALVGHAAAAGRARGSAAGASAARFAAALGEALLAEPFDAEGLARAWGDLAGPPAPRVDAGTAAGARWLAAEGVPRAELAPGEAPTLPGHLVPIALAAIASPRNLLSGTFHLAALTHPDARSCWGAVAVNVAGARLLQGFRDFLPDLLEALRANEAPADLRTPLGRLPLIRRDDLAALAAQEVPAAASAALALWLAHHEPLADRGLALLETLGPAGRDALAPAAFLLGARDGRIVMPAGWPEALGAAEREAAASLAARLGRGPA